MPLVQLSLLNSCNASLAGLMPSLKASLAFAVKESGLSREQVCDKLNSLAGEAGIRLCPNAKHLSVPVLEKWLNPSEKDHIPSLQAVQAFCLALKTCAPWEVLLQPLGLGVLTQDLRRFAAIGQEHVRLEKTRKRLRQLKESL